MAVREKVLRPWAIIQPDGVVLAAHCTCMTGLGEACHHIASMLWSIHFAVMKRQDTQRR